MLGDGYVNQNDRIVNRPEKPRKKSDSLLEYEKLFESELNKVRDKKRK